MNCAKSISSQGKDRNVQGMGLHKTGWEKRRVKTASQITKKKYNAEQFQVQSFKRANNNL